MIDFPVSPANGQIFSATNGVVYKYSTTYSSWLAQNPAPPLGGTGDFYAYANAQLATFGPGSAVIIPNTVLTGNAGLWYNTANGRYTPPAGRYLIMAGAMFTDLGPGGSNADIQIRKNGVAIGAGRITASGGHVLAATSYYGDPQGTVIIDANGADFFDVLATTAVSACAIINYWFGAFPLTGMQGPTGGAPGPVVGDFAAAGTPALGTTAQVMVMPVLNGNSGGYYNAATGRWTPPAGRYNLYGAVGAYSNATGITISAALRKNGVVIFGLNAFTAQNGWGLCPIETQVDANGSDYFDLWGQTAAAATGSQAYFGAFPTQGMVGPQGPMGPAGVTQTVFFETGAVATGTTLIPLDDTIPQQTEGDQYMSLAITPLSATSKLVIEVVGFFANSITGVITAALFQDAGANAIAALAGDVNASNGRCPLAFRHVMTSGTTAPTTFKLRAGPNGGGATVTFNGVAGGRWFGGVMASSIVIREVP